MNRKLGGFLPAAALMIAVTGIALGLVVAGSGAAHSQNQPPPPGGQGGQGGIPEAAFEACEGLAVDAACPIVTPEGESLTGQCAPTPDDKLACVPEGNQPPPPRD